MPLTASGSKKKVKEDEPVKPEVPNFSGHITTQVFASLGKPKDLHLIKACHLWDNRYRVNVWRNVFAGKTVGAWNTNKDDDIVQTCRITDAFFVKVNDTGDIVSSSPEIQKKY